MKILYGCQNHIIFLLALLLLSPSGMLSIIIDGAEDENNDLAALIKDKSGISIYLEDYNWRWTEDDIFGTFDEGGISFHTTKWFMYLIHWGPIQVSEITKEYVEARMSTMWGVDFEFTGKTGIAAINGHRAVWVEAYGTNRLFYTRFVIWNCNESGREFIGDLNYNLKLKTPKRDFRNQYLSIKTVQCHNASLQNRKEQKNEWIKYYSDLFDLSFYHPRDWFIFDSPYYIPFDEYIGIRNNRTGSLLGLGSDQNVHATLLWFTETNHRDDKIITMGVDRSIIENLLYVMRNHNNIREFQNGGRESFYIGERRIHRIWGTCTVHNFDNSDDAQFYKENGVYQAAQWTDGDKKVVLILITRSYRFGIEQSIPSRHIHDELLKYIVTGIQPVKIN